MRYHAVGVNHLCSAARELTDGDRIVIAGVRFRVVNGDLRCDTVEAIRRALNALPTLDDPDAMIRVIDDVEAILDGEGDY